MEIAAAVAMRHRELSRVLETIDLETLLGESELPGWSRLTIVCHLRYGAQASEQMTSDALADLPTGFYPGGRAAQRPSTLQPAPDESAADVIQSFNESSAVLDETWSHIPAEAWDETTTREPVGNPDLGSFTLKELAILRLTEVEVHGTDLDLGLSDWSDTFINAAWPMRVTWLPRRHSISKSSPISWNLVPTDGPAFNVSVRQAEVTVSEGTGDNAGVVISGSQAQLLGMLLGRVDISRLAVSGNEVTALQFPNAFLPP